MPPPREDPAAERDWQEADEIPEDDLWFLPGPDPEAYDLPPGAPPLPVADRRALVDPTDWQAAQDALSGDLARLAQVFGELDLRLRGAGAGARHRLALREAADLSWWSGDRVALDKLGLWIALRAGARDDTEQALARAGWAVRRLSGGPAPAAGIADFLERPVEEDAAGQEGAEPGAVASLAEIMAYSAALHPVTQAALLFQAWRILGAERTRDMEAAVLAARHAAAMSRRPGQGALFLPLATTGPGAFQGAGEPAAKLAAWIAGAEQASLAALLQLERIAEWERAAQEATADLSGRTPARLIAVLAQWPLVSAPLAEAETGASRAAIQRNLDRLTARGLIREVTGQGRYRLWAARA